MKTAFVSLATVALFVASAVAQLQINTPANVVVCQPVQFTWSGGTAPYFLSILPGSDPSAAALQDLGQQSGTSFTWLANIQAGTSIGLTLRDSTGSTAQSAAFTINPGSDSSCVGKTSSASGSTSATGASSAATGTTSAATGTTSAAATTAPTTPAATTSAATSKPTTTAPATSSGTKATTGSATASATSSKNAGPTQAASFGVAGMVGAAVIALLA